MRITIIKTRELPVTLKKAFQEDENLFPEDEELIKELARIDVIAEHIPWQQENVDWGKFDAVHIRSTWDYIENLKSFLSILENITSKNIPIINPIETIIWNSNKTYLKELENKGIPIVPTVFIGKGEFDINNLDNWSYKDSKFIVKPTVGAGASGIKKCQDIEELKNVLSERKTSEELMVQPFIQSIQTEGELSFIFADDEYLYTILKTAQKGDYRIQTIYGGVNKEITPRSQDLETAHQVYKALPVPAPIARLDMVRLPDGQLAIMEAELIEPQLFLFDAKNAASKIAQALKNTVSKASYSQFNN